MKNPVIYSLMLLLPLFSCKKSGQSANSTIISTDVILTVKNNQQADLLNPAVQGSYSSSTIKVYNLKDGKFQEVNNLSPDRPQNIKLYKNGETGVYQLDLFVSLEADSEGISTTLIQFGSNQPDTIRAEIKKNDGSIGLGKVWLNSKLISNRHSPTVVYK